MFRRKTVFIVGAGASRELGLPTGAELSAQISEMCNVGINRFGGGTNAASERIIADFLRKSGGDQTQIGGWLSAMEEIQRALPFKDSIDAVVDQYHDRPEVAEVGKYMIARLILKAERESALGNGFGLPDTKNLASESWLHTFARMLFERLRKDRIEDVGQNISIICFNYDRCIERYLAYAISETFGLIPEEAIQFAARIEIIHAYGSLGTLGDWPMWGQGAPSVPFGDHRCDPWEVSSNLKTFSESVDSDTDDKIKAQIHGAEQYVYLGLSYGRQNMELLTTSHPDRGKTGLRPVFASGKGQYEQGLVTIGRSICRTYSDVIYSDGRLPPKTWIELGRTAKEVLDLHWHNILGE